MLTMDPGTRPVWARLLWLVAAVVVAAALVVLLAPRSAQAPEQADPSQLSGLAPPVGADHQR